MQNVYNLKLITDLALFQVQPKMLRAWERGYITTELKHFVFPLVLRTTTTQSKAYAAWYNYGEYELLVMGESLEGT